MAPFRAALASLLALLIHQSASYAVPRQTDDSGSTTLINLAKNIVNPRGAENGTPPDISFTGSYSITQNSPDPLIRAAGITTKALTFLYGPAVAGGPYYPSGVLGIAKIVSDIAQIEVDITPEAAGAALDLTAATAGVGNYDGLQTVDDYLKLYDGEWQNTLPNGPFPGVLSNYTNDLLFSMERLSTSPYQVRRLNPSSDSLNFQVADDVATNVTGETLQSIFSAGRLFYADYRDQGDYSNSAGHYAAACDAYFYIDSSSGDFLPLAIRTNVGSNLIYTPADTADDWLLAKIMYNVNDFWFAQWNHLASTHEVIQIIWMAAIRTLSEEHPVQGVLNRLTKEVFAIQPLAATVLFAPLATVDQVFPYTGTEAQDYTTSYYNNGHGSFQSQYFKTDLQNRGLIDASHGPALKNFPFYEDAGTIHSALNTFFTSFVDSYYSSDSVVAGDSELQAWASECNGAAKAHDFPTIIASKTTLVGILTQLAHLISPSHHTVNTNELLKVSSTLPFCPPALYKAPPTSKGVTDVVAYLPPFDKVLEQFTVGALFARPKFVGTNKTLLHMFDDSTFLSMTNSQTQSAAATFMASMQSFSSEVSSRGFDSEGLSQGMPFVWTALDPNVIPFYVAT